MSRTALALATSALLLTAAPTLAQTQEPAPPAAQPRAPADAQTRAAYDRADPLARSVFWAQQNEINPADPVAGVRLAQALRELGRHDQAAETAQAVMMIQPTNVEAMLEVGRAHIARGHAFYGIAALERAREQAPRDWRPLSLLGTAYQQVRRNDDAQAAWRQALALSPDNPDVLANLAMPLMAEGRAAEAEPLLRRAVAQPGVKLQVKLNLAMVLGLQGKMGEAEQILRRELPPESADRNLDWLRAASMQGASAAGAGSGRTWSSLQGG